MNVLNEFPPNYEKIKKVFNLTSDTIVFTYGDTIYNPSGNAFEKHLVVHESHHIKQQGEDPAGWWDRYLKDPEFRLNQELACYKKQYHFYRKLGYSYRTDLKFLYTIAKDLSGPMYGNMITFEKAMKLIRAGDK
jgi:hypothetical protein